MLEQKLHLTQTLMNTLDAFCTALAKEEAKWT
jgi:hypothetical protein